MALQAYALELNGKAEGVVIVQTTCGLPLTVNVDLFADVDEADAFIEWLTPEQCRQTESWPKMLHFYREARRSDGTNG